MTNPYPPIIFFTRLNKWIGEKRPFLVRIYTLDNAMFMADYSIELKPTIVGHMNRIIMFKSGYNEIKIGRVKDFEVSSQQFKIEVINRRNGIESHYSTHIWVGKQNILVVLRHYNP